ncbi:ATP-binding protein [Massilia niastensis]|uniref:ATP-binding protein n=1 Tax=Massilia niastensis TaxID=544911 RepID=UPI0003826949|nr:winged helix-turn-helix domain-containing protein [Massilia niastensis]
MDHDISTFTFGPFELLPVRRVLLKDGHPVPLGSRAFDILTILLERAGEVVGKDELIARAWPRSCVEESNLRVHVSALRKALDDDAGGRHIENIAGRGYSFVAPVTHGDAAAFRPAPAPLFPSDRRLAPRVIGRAGALAALAGELGDSRLVTIVGPGGIGKTTVALLAARQAAASFPDGVCLLDLGAVTDPALITSTLASALQLKVLSDDPLASICAHLRSRRLLLIVDSCEHLAAPVAHLLADLLCVTRGLKVFATSREALGLPGERVHRLAPLTVPEPDTPLGAWALSEFSALGLFAECAAGALGAGLVRSDEVLLMANICRRLDGLPLAIELAAARVQVLGLQGVASGLDDCLALLSGSRRFGDPRHQTLRAVLDWSYALLEPAEQRMLRYLSVYAGSFTVDCARAVSGANPAGAADFDPALLFNLAAKSLLVCESDGRDVDYRMLETTRSYAAERLAQAGEVACVRHAHALRSLDLAAEAHADWELLDAKRWQARYAKRVADVRLALNWSFGEDGDHELGVRLASASALLWSELSLLEEQRVLVQRALPFAADAATEMALQSSLGNALFHLNCPYEDVVAAFARAYELARALGNGIEQARTYSGICVSYVMQGNYAQALALSHVYAPYRTRNRSRVADILYDRTMALTLHFHGEQQRARFHAERLYRQPRAPHQNTRYSGVQYDQQVAAAALQSRIRWLSGYSEEAAAFGAESVDRALEIDHPISLCLALSICACPVAFWNGEQPAAALYADLLYERSHRNGLKQWQSWARLYKALQGGMRAGEMASLSPGPQAETFFTLAPQVAGPLDFARVGRGVSGWCAAELTRQKAIWMLANGKSLRQAEEVLDEAAAIAEAQGALAWLLRTAITRAHWWYATPRAAESMDQLAAVLKRFPAGRPSLDQREAVSLLEHIPDAAPAAGAR